MPERRRDEATHTLRKDQSQNEGMLGMKARTRVDAATVTLSIFPVASALFVITTPTAPPAHQPVCLPAGLSVCGPACLWASLSVSQPALLRSYL